MSAIREILNNALVLWQEITGQDPNARMMTISEWQLRETFDELNEAITLDHTQVTAILLLAHFADAYFEKQEVSFLQLLRQPGQIRERLEKPAQLLAILAQDDVVHAREQYVSSIREAVEAYGAKVQDSLAVLLDQPHELAVLRRDALRSMDDLSVHQFLKGQPEATQIKPIYNKQVHQFWNINSLLCAATHMPSGVSLNLIRHPEALQSYFCIVIRNGANLFVLTDVPDNAHPLAASMSRRPDRDLDRRSRRNWFPYDLLNLRYDADNDRLYEQESQVRQLVAYQVDALPLVPVAELEPAVLVWLTMMFDLVVERFWNEGWQAPQLSYTAEMLKSNPLMMAAEAAEHLPALHYTPVGLDPLTLADVSSAGVTEEDVGKKYDNPNAWMEERYGAQVPEVVLNLLAPPEDKLLLSDDGVVDRISTRAYLAVSDFSRDAVRAGRKEVEKIDATSFGSREKLQADRKFIARANYASHINRLAHAEYRARKEEVKSWYQKMVLANMGTILSWAGNTDLWVTEGVGQGFSGYEEGAGPQFCPEDGNGGRNFVQRYDVGSDLYPGFDAFTVGEFNRGHYECAVNFTKPSHFVLFSPANPHELALLAGCEVKDLPDVLQHWSLIRPYRGNSILDRIDPLVWRARNPWIKLNMRVRIPLSKRALAKILKEPLVEPVLLNRCARPR